MPFNIDRYNWLLIKRFRIIIPILVLVILLSGFWVYSTFFVPSYREERTSTPLYNLHAAYTYHALVTSENPFWPMGTALMNESVYFFSVSPILNTSFIFGVQAPSAHLNITTTTSVVLSVKESSEIYWRKEMPISLKTSEMHSETFTDTFVVNMGGIKTELEDIQESIDFREGTPSVEVVTYLIYSGIINDAPVAGYQTYSMPISLGAGYFRVGYNLSSDQMVVKTETKTIRIEPSILYQIVSSSILMVAIGMILFTVYLKRMFGPLDEDELTILKQTTVMAKYKDWINDGTYNGEPLSSKINTNSLKDLIKMAMDMNELVILDRRLRMYFFIHRKTMYLFKIPE